MTVLTIAWDVDDVLNELMKQWFELEWLPLHPECSLKYEDLSENPPHRLLGVSCEEYLRSLDIFRNSRKARLMKPDEEVLSWLRAHGHCFRHMALTSRPLHTIGAVSEWVFTHFGNWIRTFSFVPNRDCADVLKYDEEKKDFLRWLGKVNILVDDNIKNVETAGSLGIKGILVPRPWNKKNSNFNDALNEILSA